MSESGSSRVRALATLVVMVVVAGGLVAAMLLPLVGGAGLVARNSTSLLHALPVELTDQTPNGNTTVLAADGSLITEFYENDRTPLTPDQISPVMKQAIVDIEDSRFYEHNGVDAQGTLRALAKNVAAGGVEEGGSTLTQQLVKQTLLQTATTAEEAEAATEQHGAEGIGRKLKEARLALALEKTYSKDEILTRYLNIAYFGHGAYGIEAAAQTYFSVRAADLTLPQASVLAGLVQSPTNDDPLAHPDAATTRRNQVLNRMHELGHISDQELTDDLAAPIPTAEGAKPPNGCAGATIGGYFCDYLHTYLNQTLGLSDQALDNGGYTIRTTLRPDLQRSGEQAILQQVPADKTFTGVLTAVQPGTGHVLTMASNRQFGCPASDGLQCESVNLNAVPSKGSGSTYKVFTAATALSEGYGAHYAITAPAPYTSKVFTDFDTKRNKVIPYTLSNDDDSYKPTYDMTSALVASTNTYYVALEDQLGSIAPVVQMAQTLGVRFGQNAAQHTAEDITTLNSGAFTLGYEAISPLDLANAYATIAASGTRCDPTPLVSITTYTGQPATTTDGTPLYAGDACTPDVIAPAVANTLANMMTGVVAPSGTGRKAAVPGHDIAGKTGTTQGNETAAFAGMTPDYSAAVMYFDPKTDPVPVGGVGGGIPGQIWHDAFAPILANEPNHPFPPADPAVVAGTKGPGPGAYVAPAPRTDDDPDGQPTPRRTTPDPSAPNSPAPGSTADPAPGSPAPEPAPAGPQPAPGDGVQPPPTH
jgi:membrane peptidoglycan carboxypeptidase